MIQRKDKPRWRTGKIALVCVDWKLQIILYTCTAYVCQFLLNIDVRDIDSFETNVTR